jgi:hypothetical protein
MFGRTKQVKHVIELSDEMRQTLTKWENDLQVLEEFQREVAATGREILLALRGEALSVTAVEVDADSPGIQVFDGFDGDDEIDSEAMQDRAIARRSSPFNRVPRHKQVAWLKTELRNKGWVHPHTIARATANDEREYRYLRSSVNTRLREMMEEGMVERKEATEKGSMFQYRLIERAGH